MHLFQNALEMDPQNVSSLVLYMAAAAWAGTLIVLLFDLFANEKLALAWKLLWLPVLLLLPLVGGLFYGALSFVSCVTQARNKA